MVILGIRQIVLKCLNIHEWQRAYDTKLFNICSPNNMDHPPPTLYKLPQYTDHDILIMRPDSLSLSLSLYIYIYIYAFLRPMVYIEIYYNNEGGAYSKVSYCSSEAVML